MEDSNMDAKKVDSFMLEKGKCFPADKTMYVKEKLMEVSLVLFVFESFICNILYSSLKQINLRRYKSIVI